MTTTEEHVDVAAIATKARTTIDLVNQYLAGTLPECFEMTRQKIEAALKSTSAPVVDVEEAIKSLYARGGKRTSLIQVALLREFEAGPRGTKELVEVLGIPFLTVKNAITGLTFHGYLREAPNNERQLSMQWKERENARRSNYHGRQRARQCHT